MIRPKTKSVSLDGIKHAMSPGHIEASACKAPMAREYHIKDLDKMDAVRISMNHCLAFMNRNETLQLIASVAKAGHAQWGDEWLSQVRSWLERIE